MTNANGKVLRSEAWFGPRDLEGFLHRSGLKNQGWDEESFAGKPVIGIANSWSEATHCNAHLRLIAEHVKRGVIAAGGFPLEFPTISLGEFFLAPTSMLYRNLMAMDVEEMIRGLPIDGVVLLSNCDKTTPCHAHGRSLRRPACHHRHRRPTTQRKLARRRTRLLYRLPQVLVRTARRNDHPSRIRLHGRGDLPFSRPLHGHGHRQHHVRHLRSPRHDAPRRRSHPWRRLPPSRVRRTRRCNRRRSRRTQQSDLLEILTEDAFENAALSLLALGGSTNAIIHLTAIAGRAGIEFPLSKWEELSAKVPVIANLKPSGRYLMEDFFYAGGAPAFFKKILDQLNPDCVNVNGKTLAENVADADCHNDDVILDAEHAIYSDGGISILRGSLAPDGAVIKRSAASPKLMQHTGRAVVFSSPANLSRRIDDPDLDVTEDDILVMQNAGPIGGPGMPEAGFMPLPRKILAQGVRDMVRISDARMSGTAFGTVVLHVSPESAVGGPLALVRDGDMITLDANNGRLDLLVEDAELERRRSEMQSSTSSINGQPERGYISMYNRHVMQAQHGCDFDFAVGRTPVPTHVEPEHH